MRGVQLQSEGADDTDRMEGTACLRRAAEAGHGEAQRQYGLALTAAPGQPRTAMRPPMAREGRERESATRPV